MPRVLADEDNELVAKARSGDVPAFEKLVAKNQDRIYGLASRILNADGEAEEVVQESFLSAWQSLSTFRGDSPFGAWVSRIAANFALMRLRRRRLAQAVEAHPDAPEFNERGSLIDSVADWTPNAEGRTLDAELRQAIDQATAALPDGYREVFLLRDLEGLSYEEIAQLTGDSVGAIKSRLHRARLSLRAAIDRFFQEREP